MRVLVTGGAGFIGSHIVDRLIEEGATVAVVDNLSMGKEGNLNKRASLYREDITSPALECIFKHERPEVVIHHAAQIDVRRSVADPVSDARINILGSINVLDAAVRYGVRKVVYASSAAAYGDPEQVPVAEEHPIKPTSPYGVSKYVVEHYLRLYRRLHGLQFTALRYANVYGPRQDPLGEGGVIAIFTHRIARGRGVTIFGDGEQTRDFVDVSDVARANVLALTQGDGTIVNISRSEETSINRLVQLFEALTGREIDVTYAPERAGEIRRSALSNRRALEVLGWSPTVDLRDGLGRVLAWEQRL